MQCDFNFLFNLKTSYECRLISEYFEIKQRQSFVSESNTYVRIVEQFTSG